MLKRLRDLSDKSTSGVFGADVYGLKDEKLGTIEDVVFDEGASKVGYAVVDSGGWLRTHRFLVPADRLSSYGERENSYYVPVSRDSVTRLPSLDPDLLDSEDKFRRYESNYRTYWESVGTSANPHPGLSSLERSVSPERGPRMVERSTATASSVPVESSPTGSGTRSTVPTAVYGVYHDEDKVREAVNSLKEEGFQESEISVLFPDKDNTQKFAMEHNTKAPEGAATGGATGVIAGGVLGWLAGIGTLAIPGIGPLLAAGPIVAALAGAGAGGALGGLAGGLIGLGLPELEAKRYEKEVKEGRILVSVRCADPRFTHAATRALEHTGARDLFVTGESMAA